MSLALVLAYSWLVELRVLNIAQALLKLSVKRDVLEGVGAEGGGRTRASGRG